MAGMQVVAAYNTFDCFWSFNFYAVETRGVIMKRNASRIQTALFHARANILFRFPNQLVWATLRGAGSSRNSYPGTRVPG